MEQKIYSESVEFVDNEINAIGSSMPNEILGVKSDLLSVYLMNLVLYNQLREEEKAASPITEMLVKATILLEKVCLMEKKADSIIKAAGQEEVSGPKESARKETEGGKRAITEEMMRNKFLVKKRKVEDRTPRLKYKNKARKLAERAEIKHNKNIDTKKTKASKLE